MHRRIVPEAVDDPQDEPLTLNPASPLKGLQCPFDLPGEQAGLPGENLRVAGEDHAGAGLGAKAGGQQDVPGRWRERLEIWIIEDR